MILLFFKNRKENQNTPLKYIIIIDFNYICLEGVEFFHSFFFLHKSCQLLHVPINTHKHIHSSSSGMVSLNTDTTMAFFIDRTDFHSAENDIITAADALVHELYMVPVKRNSKKRSKRHRVKKEHRSRLMMTKTYQQKALHQRRKFDHVDTYSVAHQSSIRTMLFH